jgi:hypothetical protein
MPGIRIFTRDGGAKVSQISSIPRQRRGCANVFSPYRAKKSTFLRTFGIFASFIFFVFFLISCISWIKILIHESHETDQKKKTHISIFRQPQIQLTQIQPFRESPLILAAADNPMPPGLTASGSIPCRREKRTSSISPSFHPHNR